MYSRFVERKVRALFAQANQGNWQAIVDGLAPKFSYRFVGDTPLGGTRTTHAAMKLWWERLYRLFPQAKFTPRTVVVHGPPWRTSIMTHVNIDGTAPTGPQASLEPYHNEFMQSMTLRWGKITEVITIEDTQRFVEVLPLLSQAGIADASRPPIADAPPPPGTGRR